VSAGLVLLIVFCPYDSLRGITRGRILDWRDELTQLRKLELRCSFYSKIVGGREIKRDTLQEQGEYRSIPKGTPNETCRASLEVK
jgi:hypothetical protein